MLLRALQERRVIAKPVAIVVAHPDDETIAAGGSLYLLRDLLLVHVTDGAPRRLDDAARHGFASPAQYAVAREAELQAALALSGACPRRVALGVPDQEASDAVAAIASRLRALFRAEGVRAVLTHAYEGGHPDHDATALAVHLAGAPELVEFAGYHAGPDGDFVAQRFLPPHAGDEEVVALADADAARKARMIACFRTQAAILARFDVMVERFRRAPEYDFTAPPHAGRLNYERWGWPMSGAEWRRRAHAARAAACAG